MSLVAVETPAPSLTGPRLLLGARSACLLFVELWLIRWTGAYVVYLAYFTNLLLLASFLGIGVGFLRASRRPDRSAWAPLALAVYVAFVLLAKVEVHRTGHGLAYTSPIRVLPQWVLLPLLFAGATAIMALLGQGVARAFARLRPLDAYVVDLTGSLCGVVAFWALTLWRVPPVGLAALAGVTMLPSSRRELPIRALGLVALIVPLAVSALNADDLWSPYYRITIGPDRGSAGIAITANGVPHQTIKSVVDLRADNPIYLRPYAHLRGVHLRNVLIVGAGTGDDTAIALQEGAAHVDAVEIDGRLVDIGRDRNPSRPYDDPRVSVHVTDGRAFLEQTATRYDLVLFALPDSLTLVSGQSSLRLENYLFTKEAVRAVRDRLAGDGVFALYNYYRRPWLVDRLAETMQEVLGAPPCVDVIHGPRLPTVLLEGRSPANVRCTTPWHGQTTRPISPSTDDHPFPYLRTPSIPAAYLLTFLLVLAFAAGTVAFSAGGFGAIGGYLDLFFMGAAFLLLETKNVVQFALLFGTTWVVNALVFAGILLTLLLAVLTARRFRIRRPGPAYAGLLCALAIAWLVPGDALLALPFAPRFLAAVALAFAPVFLANLVFSERFAEASASTTAFAANLLGAIVGGVIEYTALITGYRMLLVVAALLYLAAWVVRARVPSVRADHGSAGLRLGTRTVAAADGPAPSV
jgi:SAM-dependent methyltransferase